MTLRDAHYHEIHAMACICALAFMDEELFGALMHPHRKQCPADFITFWERKMRSCWFDYNRRFIVSCDPSNGKILGVALWERQGKGGVMLGKYDPRNILSPLANLAVRSSRYQYPNRACDPSHMNILNETIPLCAHHWSGARAENWYLDILAVAPEGQGKGVGRELVQWGVEKAREEGVCASLIAAWGKERFYERCGFREVGRANVGPMEEAGIRGGAIMFTGVEGEEEVRGER